jgi:hypothetical protein
MKKLLIFTLLLSLNLSVFAQGETTRAEWRFTKSKNFQPSKSYLETGIFPTVEGIKDAGISFYHKGKMVKASLNDKGYPTAKHRDAIAKHGITPYHRLTFKGVKEFNPNTTEISLF